MRRRGPGGRARWGGDGGGEPARSAGHSRRPRRGVRDLQAIHRGAGGGRSGSAAEGARGEPSLLGDGPARVVAARGLGKYAGRAPVDGIARGAPRYRLRLQQRLHPMTDPDAPLLTARRLVAVYPNGNGGLWALDDVSFSVRRQEFACVGGASGGGKTTLLRCLAGLPRPTSGEVIFEGGRLGGARRGG